MSDFDRSELNPVFARPGEATEYSRTKIPAESSLPETAYQIVHDEAMLDGNPRQNLATFVGTWMDEYADKLYADAYDKNMIDKDEYPATAAIEARCQVMLADLWNAPDPKNTIATSTIGSSEAAMFGGLALKRAWQHRRKAEGKSTEKPNLVLSSAVQVCWEKFCNYFEVEARYVPVSMDHKQMDGFELEKYIDENTIGVVAILGVTYTGTFEPVKKIAEKLDEIQKETGLDIPMHVDGATGAMIAPFTQPDLEWDFRLDRVHSINTSGHKYGLVYPGLGWVVWRNKDVLPEDLIFNVSYLGGSMPTLALNFSRPGAQVLLQYYLFLRLGHDGYRRVQENSIKVATYLAEEISKLEPFEIWAMPGDTPIFAWFMKEGYGKNWTLYDLADRLRMRGWQVPAYPLPADLEDVSLQRIVVRNGVTLDMARALAEDIKKDVEFLENLDGPMPRDANQGKAFHH